MTGCNINPLNTAMEILCAETFDLEDLARMAGRDPYRFYEGADFREADLTSEDLTKFSLRGANISRAKMREADRQRIEAESEGRHYIRERSDLLPFDFDTPWIDQFKEQMDEMANAPPFKGFEGLMRAALLSFSLSPLEKFNVLNAAPRLSQFQIDELTKVFADEIEKFAELAIEHPDDIAKLIGKSLIADDDLDALLDGLARAAKPGHNPRAALDPFLSEIVYDYDVANLEFFENASRIPQNGKEQNALLLRYATLRFLLRDRRDEHDDVRFTHALDKCLSILRSEAVLAHPISALAWFISALTPLALEQKQLSDIAIASGVCLNSEKNDGGLADLLRLSEALRGFVARHQPPKMHWVWNLVGNRLQCLEENARAIECFDRTIELSAGETDDKTRRLRSNALSNSVEAHALLGQDALAREKAGLALQGDHLGGSSRIAVRFTLWLLAPDTEEITGLMEGLDAIDGEKDKFGWTFEFISPLVEALSPEHKDAAEAFIAAFEKRRPVKKTLGETADLKLPEFLQREPQ